MLDRRRFLSYIPIAATSFGRYAWLLQRRKAPLLRLRHRVGLTKPSCAGHGITPSGVDYL